MNNKGLIFALTLAAVTSAASLTAIRPAQATDTMMKSDAMMKMDCSQAGSMMSDAAKGTPPAMTGDTDKDFMALVMDHEKGTMMLMKIEASCGKDPKTKAMAAKEAAAADARMQMFRNQNMSQ